MTKGKKDEERTKKVRVKRGHKVTGREKNVQREREEEEEEGAGKRRAEKDKAGG